MNKAELVRIMMKKAEERGKAQLTVAQSQAAVTALMESVTEALKNGEKVVLPGFGMFGVRMRPARRGYNPLTGEQIALPEKKLPAFKAGKTLKDAVAAE